MLRAFITLTFLPFLGLFFVGDLPLLAKTGNILGYLGIVMMIWSVILGAKPLSRIISNNYVELNKNHRFLGKYGVIFVLLHPLIQMYSYLENYTWIFTPSFESELELHISAGRAALFIFLVIWLSSWFLRSKLRYRPWLLIHYLTYPLLLLALFHMRDIGYYWANFPIINVTFNLIFVGYIIFLAYMFLFWAGFFKKTYRLENIEIIGKGSQVAILDLVTNGKPLMAVPGQYIYLQINGFGEARPFSILGNDGQNLRLGIKLEGPFTKKVHQLQPGKEIFIYGPLGEFTKEGHNNEDKIIISGGIGITPLVGLAHRYFTPRSTFIVCNRYQEDVVGLSDLKNIVPPSNLYELYSQERIQETDHLMSCRLDKDILGRIIANYNNQKVFLCGSSGFMKATIENLENAGVPKKNIFTEEFSF